MSRPTKHEIVQWAATRYELDLRARTLLKTMAYFAEDDGDTWVTMDTLARELGCSVRTAQYTLRDMEERGYARHSGRSRRLKGSTRSVPIYVLAPTIAAEEDAAAVESMGAETAPMDGAWVQDQTGMGAAVCTRKNPLESTDIQKGACAQADEDLGGLADAYQRVEQAYPPEALGHTDTPMARRALADLIGQGVSVDDLVAAAADYEASAMRRKRDLGPVGLQRWLGEGRYRGFGPFLARAKADRLGAARGAGVVVGDAAGAVAWAGPAALRADLLAKLGAGFAATLDRCGWAAEARRVRACTGWAFGKLTEAAGIFEQHGCELVAPNGGE